MLCMYFIDLCCVVLCSLRWSLAAGKISFGPVHLKLIPRKIVYRAVDSDFNEYIHDIMFLPDDPNVTYVVAQHSHYLQNSVIEAVYLDEPDDTVANRFTDVFIRKSCCTTIFTIFKISCIIC